ncbi:MAG TPA: flavin reductase family protein [Actinocatenispora sp.]
MTGPGAEIHGEHPYAEPVEHRAPVRRLRGRLTAPVTLWTAGTGRDRAGLTVASVLVVDGDPGAVVGMIDPDSDLADAIDEYGTFAVTPLGWDDRLLADRFGGLAPAPGGLFAQDPWTDTDWGPVPAGAGTWLGCRASGTAQVGWSRRVDAVVEHLTLGDDIPALAYRRGRYHRIDPS